MNVANHYDLLIEENNDPFHDPPELQAYMDRWDGPAFLDSMQLSCDKTVLEIGIGTGRIARKVAPRCLRLTGIDISPKTIERASENLRAFSNVHLICADFLSHGFAETYDVIYSSLTMMHFPDKKLVIKKVATLLSDGGMFCLSIDKSQNEYLDMGTRRLRTYPDTLENTLEHIRASGLLTENILETEYAYLFVSRKG